eukprot:1300289-Amphidinium_carterae.1
MAAAMDCNHSRVPTKREGLLGVLLCQWWTTGGFGFQVGRLVAEFANATRSRQQLSTTLEFNFALTYRLDASKIRN